MSDSPAMRRQTELECTAEITRYQRDWFKTVNARVADGEPFAVLSADSPHEIYRAMDIPYVVVQWWSSVIAAKQLGPTFLQSLADAGYPDNHDQYNSLGLGELLANKPEIAPWGGLPRPTFLQAALATDGLRDVYDAWAYHSGAILFPFERTVDIRNDPPENWWDELPRNWNTFLPRARVDVLEQDLTDLIQLLKSKTGRRFSDDRLAEVMQLANEQAEFNLATRDLIAKTRPAPVSATETMPAVMIPQWHRGSVWARDAAARLSAEVSHRVETGKAVCPSESVRLMWIGRGLWSSLGLYQWFQEHHDAVFVWSMYLGLAADGYARYVGDGDPVRALASRFVPMGEELRMPTWSSAWHLKEALLHQVDGVVSLGEDDYFSVKRLEAAGIPVLSIKADNVDRRTWAEEELIEIIGTFIEERARPAARRRHHD
jgi:2-hydroxyglutaryl-CoA dehydratase, D-component